MVAEDEEIAAFLNELFREVSEKKVYFMGTKVGRYILEKYLPKEADSLLIDLAANFHSYSIGMLNKDQFYYANERAVERHRKGDEELVYLMRGEDLLRI